MNGLDGSAWPTATTEAGLHNRKGASATSGDGLSTAAKAWGTPRASDGEKGGPNMSFGAGGTPLPAQAAQWPTPAARDWKGENGADHLTNGTGRLHMDQLPNAVAHGFSRPAPAIMPDGLQPSPHAPISRPLWASMIASHGRVVSRRILKGRSRRRLNPLFVGWLMGWPIGHALCACSATEFTLWQQHMRGALSQLPMASGPWIWTPPIEAKTPQQLMLI